jgi:hypothetical protein
MNIRFYLASMQMDSIFFVTCTTFFHGLFKTRRIGDLLPILGVKIFFDPVNMMRTLLCDCHLSTLLFRQN